MAMSTVQTSSPDCTEPVTYEVFNVSVNSSSSSSSSSSSMYLRHNSTLEDVQVFWTGSTSVQVLVFVAMVSACSVLGTLGNIPVLLVYCKTRERRTSNTFIKVLAVIDLVVCALIMPYSLVMELHLITSDILCRLLEFVRHVSIGASNFTLVAIAIERYMAVCVITRRLTVHNVNQGMFVVMAVSVLLAIPSMGVFAVVGKEEVRNISCSFPHDLTKPTFSFCHFTTSLLGPALSTAYQAVLMLFFLLTFTLIVVLYTLVYSSLWKRAKRRTFMQSTSIEVEVTSSNDRQRSQEGSSQEPEEDKQEVRDGEKTELQARDKLILCSPAPLPQLSAPEQIRHQPDADRFQSWTKVEEAVRCIAVSSHLRKATQARLSRHRRTARMLFLCSVVFLLTWLPFWVDVFTSSHILCLRYLFFLGNASNPVVYGICNSHFRQSLVRLLAGFKAQFCSCKR